MYFDPFSTNRDAFEHSNNPNSRDSFEPSTNPNNPNNPGSFENSNTSNNGAFAPFINQNSQGAFENTNIPNNHGAFEHASDPNNRDIFNRSNHPINQGTYGHSTLSSNQVSLEHSTISANRVIHEQSSIPSTINYPSENEPDNLGTDHSMNNTERLWQDIPYAPREGFPFTGPQPGPVAPVKNELKAFKLFFTDAIIEGMLEQANSCSDKPTFKKARKKDTPFQKINAGELWRWIALVILTGMHGKRTLADNWSTDPLLRAKIFGETMPRDRFLEIFACLEFDGDEGSNLDNELAEARSFIFKFRSAFQNSYNLKKDICIGKSTTIRKGYQIHALSEIETGYVWDVFPEDGENTAFVTFPGSQILAKPGLAAMTMVSPLLQRGHSIFVDEMYTDLALFHKLVEYKTDCIGGVPYDCRFLPKSITQKRWKKTDKGQVVSKYYGKFCLMNFLDYKEFKVLSSVGVPSPLGQTGKPELSNMLLAGTTGTELFKKNSGEKPFRNQLRSFFKKLFFHIVDICLLNAFTISKHNPDMKKNDFEHFQLALVRAIFMKYTYPPPQPTASSDPNWIRLNGRHIKFDKYQRSRRCVVCSKAGFRRDVRRGCAICKVPLCLEDCYELYHTKKDFVSAKQKRVIAREEQAKEALEQAV